MATRIQKGGLAAMAVLLLAMVIWGLVAAGTSDGPKRPHIIFILADDLVSIFGILIILIVDHEKGLKHYLLIGSQKLFTT